MLVPTDRWMDGYLMPALTGPTKLLVELAQPNVFQDLAIVKHLPTKGGCASYSPLNLYTDLFQ